jgi:hypothetical protein
MSPRDPTNLANHSVSELILGGDWASTECFVETLAAIARQLAGRVRPEERIELEQVAGMCAIDMGAATALWIVATAPLRERCRQAGPRHTDAQLAR